MNISLSLKRHRWMIQVTAESFNISKDAIVEDYFKQPKNYELLKDFLDGKGAPKIFIYYQIAEGFGNDDMKDSNADPSIIINNGEDHRLKSKGIYFYRTLPEGKPVNLNESTDHEILFGEISPQTVVQLNGIVEAGYQPMIYALERGDWGETDDEQQKEFLGFTKKFATEVSEALKSLNSGINICKFNQDALARCTTDDARFDFYLKSFSEWLKVIHDHLNEEPETGKKDMIGQKEEPGPHTELDYWRARMQKITSLSEQLKTKDFLTAKGAINRKKQEANVSIKSRTEEINNKLAEYNRIDIQITDKLNEAKDNVKYLATLEKFIEPLYTGTPQQIIETLPALMNAIKMIHTIARYYSTTENMTNLFVKITNQMINNCRKQIQPNQREIDAIWKRDPEELISILRSCISLSTHYREEYKKMSEKIRELPKGRHLDVTESTIFSKFDSFVRRLQKLIDIFSTIQQFTALSQHNLEGMDKLTNTFKQQIDKFRAKKYDLLDHQNSKFDRDFVQFNVEISQLDGELQNFIDQNITRFRNIEISLKLLRKFETILKRDALRHNLTSKYNAILHSYATELENILKIFNDQRQNPPLVRNMPPEAGKIIWARHLFKKITGPINSFPANQINQSEMKKHYGAYNSLGKHLTVYEMWYYQSWCNDIERAKAGLQATLIIRSDENKKLYVNFDHEIMQLIREAKVMDRNGIDIPESARIILLQEDKFKMYYNELLYVLKEYERIISKIKPITKQLLSPHVEDLELKLRPGMVTLTWTSMNIDAYLRHVHQGLNKLEQLIIKVNDIIENRIENNLKTVSKVLLVNMPQGTQPLSLEAFVKMQEDHISNWTDFLMSKNVEVERAVEDLLQTIINYPLDPHVDPISTDETLKIKKYYAWYLYQALLNSTQNSLNSMKYHVCGRKSTPGQGQGNQKPFFVVHIELDGAEIVRTPSVDEIQRAINRAATAVLRCSKNLFTWDQQDAETGEKSSYYDTIAKEKEIVKVILLLTGSIQGTKNKVDEFVYTFEKFDWLWKNNIGDSLAAFNQDGKKKPTLIDYEEELKKFAKTEEEIEKIELEKEVGAMALKTDKIKGSLVKWILEWKTAYTEDLHKHARDELEKLTDLTKSLQTRLQKEVKDISSLGDVMKTLEEIRLQQAEIDMKFGPVFEMYNLLNNYLQTAGGTGLDKEEEDAKSMLKRNWDKLIKDSEEKQADLQSTQGKYLKTLKNDVKNFIGEVKEFRDDFEKNGPMVAGIPPQEAMTRLKNFEEQYSIKERTYKTNNLGENLFGLHNRKYPELELTKAQVENLKQLYNLYSQVIETVNSWREKPWNETSLDNLKEMEENIGKYGDMCIRLPKDLKEWGAYKELKLEIDNFKEVLPMIMDLKKPSIKDRHWKRIQEVTGKTLNFGDEDRFYLNDIIEARLLDHKEDIEDICDSADKQQKIDNNLREIREYWGEASFEFTKWKREVFCMLKGDSVQLVLERLDEDNMAVSTIAAMKHNDPFRKEIEYHQATLTDVGDTLNMWIKVQGLWSSLEAVFTGGDIAKNMPLQAKRFIGIDKTWTNQIMQKAAETKKVVACCQNDILKGFLPELYRGLEDCQKSLEEYLESKRKNFPRFYFVSDPVLLKILSQGSDPTSIQDEFEKLFDAISKVTFDKADKKSQAKKITQIMSLVGRDEEIINLADHVICEGNIEIWLDTLRESMQTSLKDITRGAWEEFSVCPISSLTMVVDKYCSQVALLGIQLRWTKMMTEGLEKGKDKGVMNQKKAEVKEMTDILIKLTLNDLKTKLNRTKVETLITIQVHQREVTDELVDKKRINNIGSFDWQQQTRLYWRYDQDNCFICITDWEDAYSYEYLGAKERLCITPLTDRCYITLAQALSMYYGGAPAGPAGTGKTETVKDMGRTLGVFVVVTNCSDQHRYKDMAKIFKGLCQSGLWGCFDEFNRIELEVLSVVAQQVEAIGSAKKQHAKTFSFPGETMLIQLVQTVGYFITMNPGYAGRQELPENLKVLFRSVSMMVPNRETIIRVKLASVGYEKYELLAKKFTILYGLCEEQLSKQRHYDFGLRNILSVLRTAGNTKRIEQEQPEDMLLMRTLRDMNLSKLVAEDEPLFIKLLEDIFPSFAGDKMPVKKRYPEVEDKIVKVVKENNLVNLPTAKWFDKVIQLYETSLVRHGFMLVGPTGSGKTAIMITLTKALSFDKDKARYDIQRMNPKAITAPEMYGVKNEISGDWTPGIFSTIWQKANNRNSKTTNWITCDGPVDAIWIENLNTVLDDNKILTLASGDRIPMTDNCKLVFEVENLNNASPATVSRCGIIFVSDTDLGLEPVWRGWLIRREQLNRKDENEKLTFLLEKYFKNMNIIDIIEKTCKEPMMDVAQVIKLSNSLNLLTGLLQPLEKQSRTLTEAEYEKLVLWSLCWGGGGVYESKERGDLHDYLSAKGCPVPPRGKDNETIYEYYLDTESRVGSVDWKLVTPEQWKPADKNISFSNLLLPTLDSTRAELLINLITNQPKIPFGLCTNSTLLIGGSGTAKTSSVLMYAKKFKDDMLFKRMNFSSATQPGQFQASIEEATEDRIGRDYGPKGGKLMTVFVDDISMPFVNKWGDQITLEIVRQMIEQNGFYYLLKDKRGDFRGAKNLFYIGAMNHPGGGRNDIPNRLKRQFFIFNMIPPANIEPIYGAIINFMFRDKQYQTFEQLKAVAGGLTNATIKLWNKVKNNLLPTPSKFHYIFTMRELARIFKGIVQMRKDEILKSSTFGTSYMKPEIYLIALWKHECERVFVDKLTNQKDKDIVLNYIHDIAQESFYQHEAEINEKLGKDKSIYFCNFLRADVVNEEGIVEVPGERVYEAIADIEKLRARVNDLLDNYNKTYPQKKMNLVLFDDALKHMLRISRIIEMPRSSALLVGVGGSGKQSLTRLAGFIGRQKPYSITVTKTYGEKDLMTDIKTAFDMSGHKGDNVTFLMTDAEVKNEGFLEYINMVLSTGEIPGLLAKDEKEIWLGDIRTDFNKEKGLGNYDPTQAELYNYLVERIRDKLHMVLSFSPVGPKFRERARKFPALFNECTIDWFLPWPEEALISVAHQFVSKYKDLDTKPEIKAELPKHMGQVHLMVNGICEVYFQQMRRQVYVTPKSYLAFLAAYKDLYSKKYWLELDEQEKSFKKGLDKIAEAQIKIQELTAELKVKEQVVKKATEEADVIMKKLEVENAAANKKKNEVEANANQCRKQETEISADKEKALKEYEEAVPALKAAEEAVGSIKPDDITFIKKLGSPPGISVYVFECVNILLYNKIGPVVWIEKKISEKLGTVTFLKDSFDPDGKALLADPDLLKKVKDKNIGNTVNEEHIELLEPYLSQKEWFNAEQAKNAAKAVLGLYSFVSALAIYFEKSKIVKPKLELLTIQEARLQEARKELAQAQAELDEVNKFVAGLKALFTEAVDKKNALEEESRQTKRKIEKARELIESLSGEKIRWAKGKEEIVEQKRRLIGNVSMSCAFISYCGPFNAEFRSRLLNDHFIGDMKKRGIPYTVGLELTSFLVDDATIGEWNLQGLPKDDLSIQNGIMVTNSSRFPLLIDPQGQGQSWIRKKYDEDIEPRMSITNLNHPRFKDHLRFCLEEGKCMIIEGIQNEVDSMVDPVLEKQTFPRGKNLNVKVGDAEYTWMDNFKLFMTCKLSNPLFSPELSAKTTIIDFTVTQRGLEQQLLGRVISKEKRSLEETLNNLLTEVTQNKKDLQRLDRDLLKKLTETKGNLLDDNELIEVLKITKNQAKEVEVKLADAEVKTKEINENREKYRSVAIRGSVLYFCMIEVSLINWMYNSSLLQFLGLFDYSVDNAKKDPLESKRVENIIKFLTNHVYRYVNRGLFERDKITFILMICFKIMTTDEKISNQDISIFLKSGTTLDRADKPNPVSAWLENKIWLNTFALSKHIFQGEPIPFFKDLCDNLSRNEAAWKAWFLNSEPEAIPIPDYEERIKADKEIGPFIHLCLIRALREDRTLVAAKMFINARLDKSYTDPVSDPIESIYEESYSTLPVVFLLTAGADPTSAIDDFARKKKKYPCDKVSMGEGQDKYADESIKKGFIDGSWTILQNCHLGLKFMEDLETILGGDKQGEIHPDFRLWITCEPTPRFPLSLLQRGIKVTNEPPKGVKAGLWKTFNTTVNQDFLEKVDHSSWRSIIYAICFLHSVVIERRKFGPLGFCVPYEFNNSDLEASLQFIEKYLTSIIETQKFNADLRSFIQWNVIRYMVCEVQYGGRITDDLDRELFNTYGEEIFLRDQLLQSSDFTFVLIEKGTDGSKTSYKCPQGSEIKVYRDYIEKIPGEDNPELFGLHSNADITYRLKESLEMINTIMITRPKEGGGGKGKTREEEVQDKTREFLGKMPPDYNMNEVKNSLKNLQPPKGYPRDGKGSNDTVPTTIFLRQEIQRMQRVIQLVRKTFIDLIDAIDGTIIMTPALLEAIDYIYDGRVPPEWLYDPSGAEISWLLPTFGAWFNSLLERNTKLTDWLKNGRPQTFWLTGFFNPQGFLTAMKQEVTRMHKGGGKTEKDKDPWSLDDVVYTSAVKEKEADQMKEMEGVLIEGLWIEGAMWKKGSLADPEGKSMFYPLPLLHVSADNAKGKKAESDKAQYNCPVYKYPRKTDKYLIFRVKLQGDQAQKTAAQWKLRGVALLCSKE